MTAGEERTGQDQCMVKQLGSTCRIVLACELVLGMIWLEHEATSNMMLAVRACTGAVTAAEVVKLVVMAQHAGQNLNCGDQMQRCENRQLLGRCYGTRCSVTCGLCCLKCTRGYIGLGLDVHVGVHRYNRPMASHNGWCVSPGAGI